MRLIEDWKQSWKFATVWISAVWGAMCTVFVAMPKDTQIDLISLLGINGAGALAAFNFVAQVAAVIAATTIAARVTQFTVPSKPKE